MTLSSQYIRDRLIAIHRRFFYDEDVADVMEALRKAEVEIEAFARGLSNDELLAGYEHAPHHYQKRILSQIYARRTRDS